MDTPTSVVAAVSLSAAAGKNPWIPLGLVFLLAAPESIPEFFMEPELHAALHNLGPQSLLYGLAGLFIVVAVLESLADKLPVVETWLLPVSTAWRPFAAATVAAILGYAGLSLNEGAAVGGATLEAGYKALEDGVLLSSLGGIEPLAGDYWTAALMFVLTVVLGLVFGWLSTIGKVGTRLLLTLVPVPGIKFMHSWVDDFFAIAVSLAGFIFADSWVFVIALGLYLLVGMFTGPFLTRVTRIHFRIGLMLFRKLRTKVEERPPEIRIPGWAQKALKKAGVDQEAGVVIPVYAKKLREVGRFRDGYLAINEDGVRFATKVRMRARVLSWTREEMHRFGVAETTTARAITLNAGPLQDPNNEQLVLHLYPMAIEELTPHFEKATALMGLVGVKPESGSARGGLFSRARVGQGDPEDPRYVPEAEAGTLRTQGLLTIAAAAGVGILTGGAVVPIGAGYLLSPFRLRALVGLTITAYLTLCVLGTGGLAWPAAVLYAVVLNALSLRDLSRAALQARIEGYVDRSSFMPVVAGQVWIPAEQLKDPEDRLPPGTPALVTDGSYKTVLKLLTSPAPSPA